METDSTGREESDKIADEIEAAGNRLVLLRLSKFRYQILRLGTPVLFGGAYVSGCEVLCPPSTEEKCKLLVAKLTRQEL
jgi:hypothetical protein